MLLRRAIIVAVAAFWHGAAMSQPVTFSAEKFYRDLESEFRDNYKQALESADVVSKQRAAAGLPHITDATRGLAEDGIKTLMYTAAVMKTLCFEQGFRQNNGRETTRRIIKDCVDRSSNDFAKFNKLLDYVSKIPSSKTVRCEMKSRDYDSEIRFPPFDFLLNADGSSPHFFDYSALNDCLLAD